MRDLEKVRDAFIAPGVACAIFALYIVLATHHHTVNTWV